MTREHRLLLELQHERRARRASFALVDASRRTPQDVVQALHRAILSVCPLADTMLFYERLIDEYVCVSAIGSRAPYFEGTRIAVDCAPSPVAGAGRLGHHIFGYRSGVSLIPSDRSFLALPLIDSAALNAVCYLSSHDGDLAAQAAAILPIVDLAGAAYRAALDRAADRKEAMYDGLTGLLTPRAFRRELARRVANLPAHGRLHLLFIDTDNFKACNDTLGHATGDLVLRSIATALASTAGADALVARHGGDEFSVTIATPMKSQAILFAERLRLTIAHDIDVLDAEIARLPQAITASIGVASLPRDADTPERLLERADVAMYHSKRSGRNIVSYFDDAGCLTLLRKDGQPNTESRAAERRRFDMDVGR